MGNALLSRTTNLSSSLKTINGKSLVLDGESTIPVDTDLNSSSTNLVQNQAISKYIDIIVDSLQNKKVLTALSSDDGASTTYLSVDGSSALVADQSLDLADE